MNYSTYIHGANMLTRYARTFQVSASSTIVRTLLFMLASSAYTYGLIYGMKHVSKTKHLHQMPPLFFKHASTQEKRKEKSVEGLWES